MAAGQPWALTSPIVSTRIKKIERGAQKKGPGSLGREGRSRTRPEGILKHRVMTSLSPHRPIQRVVPHKAFAGLYLQGYADLSVQSGQIFAITSLTKGNRHTHKHTHTQTHTYADTHTYIHTYTLTHSRSPPTQARAHAHTHHSLLRPNAPMPRFAGVVWAPIHN